ncbi:tyrosine-type recombinase/integrase [Listeria welshimeri]|nr:tyrosine-type recombinase/integrase [Listeria welshimeri]MBC1993854.1 tyrosine-type recombinase/integrase [Listeria welshimeri]MBC2006297.1 tyrosine-type recombinase/integrase [Listeria welshimeri]MBC2027285.1 tyrosine-type recombinase/integrase [Listeria welshimeri]
MLSKLFNTDSSLFCHSRVEHFLSEENSNIEFKALQERQFHIRENFGTKKIQRICNRCAVQPIRLHDFRHSHVALLIDNGENITVIKERMGHSSITTTIDTYGHLFPNKQREMSDKLDFL